MVDSFTVVTWTEFAMLLFATVLSFVAGSKFWQDSKVYLNANPDSNNQDFTLLCTTGLIAIFFKSFALFCGALVTATRLTDENTSFADAAFAFRCIGLTCRMIQETSHLIFLVSRLRISFDSSAYKLSNRTIHVFYMLIVFGILCAFITFYELTFANIHVEYFYYVVVFTACFLLGVPISVAVMFAKKLFQLVLTARVSVCRIKTQNNNVNKPKTSLSTRQAKILDTIVKQTSLAFADVVFGFFTLVLVILSVVFNWKDGWIDESLRSVFPAIYLITDAFRVIPIWLSFIFAKDQYQKLCSSCHSHLHKSLENWAITKLNQRAQHVQEASTSNDIESQSKK